MFNSNASELIELDDALLGSIYGGNGNSLNRLIRTEPTLTVTPSGSHNDGVVRNDPV